MAKAISLQEARSRVLAHRLPARASEPADLASALGRYLAEDVCADGPWPATDRSAMDGFAVAAGAGGLPAGVRLPVVGESLAGRPFAGALPPGSAIRIMTGAVVPTGADAVVPVEQTAGFASAVLEPSQPVRKGQHVRPMGSEMQAGGRLLLRGRRLGPAEIGALAVLGRRVVPVQRPVVVAVVATGDEVVPIDTVPLPHQVRESNSWALAAQVAALGARADRRGIAPDEPQALRAVLAAAIEGADVVVTIGGISKGTHDLVHGTLAELGVRTEFHGIELKPGKPTYFGVRDAATGARCAFGLPGNPASAFTVFDLLVRPLLLQWYGAPVGATVGAATVPVVGGWHANSRLQAIPARLVAHGGGLAAALVAPSPSGDPFSLLGGDCYALVPPGNAGSDQLPLVGGALGPELP